MKPLHPVHPKPSAPWSDLPETPKEQLSAGDRVVYFTDAEAGHGMVLELMKEGMVLISTVSYLHTRPLHFSCKSPWEKVQN